VSPASAGRSLTRWIARRKVAPESLRRFSPTSWMPRKNRPSPRMRVLRPCMGTYLPAGRRGRDEKEWFPERRGEFQPWRTWRSWSSMKFGKWPSLHVLHALHGEVIPLRGRGSCSFREQDLLRLLELLAVGVVHGRVAQFEALELVDD